MKAIIIIIVCLMAVSQAAFFRHADDLRVRSDNITAPSYLDQYCAQYGSEDDCAVSGGANDFYYYCVWDADAAVCAAISHTCPPVLARLANATGACGASDVDPCPRPCRRPFLRLWTEACREAGLTHLDSFEIDPTDPSTAKVLADLTNCDVYRDTPQPYCDVPLDVFNRALINATDDVDVSGGVGLRLPWMAMASLMVVGIAI